MTGSDEEREDLEQEIAEIIDGDEDLQRVADACRDARAQPSAPEGLPLSPLLSPGIYGDFRILRQIGRGGMGIVYEAEQLPLGRKVAIKTLFGGLKASREALGRFTREARAAAALQHRNIVAVYGCGEIEGVPFYSMEHIPGPSLDQVIRALNVPAKLAGSDPLEAGGTVEPTALGEAPDSPRFFGYVARLFVGVADALHAAHRAGIVHRDIKPSNLILDIRGRLVLTDFGIARQEGTERLTVSGEVLGTPHYMSPEQAEGDRGAVDFSTDIYSLGVTLYELVTLETPFAGTDQHVVLSQIISKDPAPPRRANPRVPRDLETIILKAMEKEPRRRYATAGDMADDLRRFSQGEMILARPSGPVTRLFRKARRRPALSAMACFSFACAVLIAFLGASYVRTARAAREAEARKAIEEGMLLLYSIVEPSRPQAAPAGSEDLLYSSTALDNFPPGSTSGMALQLFEKAARNLPGHPDPIFYLALAHQAEGNVEEVQRCIDASLELNANHRPSLLLQAACLRARGSEEDARKVEERARADRAESWAFDWFQALDAERKSDWKAATESYTQLIDSGQEPYRGFKYQAYLRRAQAAMQLKDFEEARLDIARAEGAWEKRIEGDLVQALLLRHEGKRDESQKLLENLLERADWQPQIVLRVVETFLTDDAETHWRLHGLLMKGLERHPRSEGLLTARVELLVRRQDDNDVKVEDCLHEARKLVDLYPSSARAFMALGRAYLENWRLDEAIDPLRRASDLDPQDPAILALLGDALRRTGSTEEAESTLRRSTLLKPTPAALISLAGIHDERGNLMEAERLLRRSTSLDSMRPLSHLHLAMILFRLGSWEDARRSYREYEERSRRLALPVFGTLSHDLDPEGAIRWASTSGIQSPYAFASTFSHLDMAGDAEAILQSYSAADPSRMLSALPYLRYFECKYSEALDLVREGRKQSPSEFRDMETTWVAFSAGAHEEGLAAFKRYVKEVPNPNSPWDFYSDLLLARSAPGDAEAFLTGLREENPDQIHIRQLLVEAYHRAGKHEQAIQECEKVVKSGNGDGWWRLAEALRSCRKPEERLEYWSGASESRPGDLSVLWLEGDALQDCGRWQEALDTYLRVLSRKDSGDYWNRVAAYAATRFRWDDQLQFWKQMEARFDSYAVRRVRQDLASRRPGGPVRINCGGAEHIDRLGDRWSSDLYYSHGAGQREPKGPERRPVKGTPEQPLYATNRQVGRLLLPDPLYRIPVENGKYVVSLHFAENWNFATSPGLRCFDVLLQGKPVIEDLDICREVGYLRPLVLRFETEVTDGLLTIALRRKLQNPLISAVEVMPVSRRYLLDYREKAQASLGREAGIEEALAFFAGETDAFPDRPDAWHLRGELELQARKAPEAARSFREALRLDPGRLGSKIRLADAARLSGRFLDALQAYREILLGDEYSTFELWAALAAASRNALSDKDLLDFWRQVKTGRRQDSAAWDFASFFEEQLPLGGPIRLNCGGERTAVADGTVYLHDSGYRGGGIWCTDSSEVTGVHSTARWVSPSLESFEYDLPVRTGRYQVTLHFAEIVELRSQPGKRIFSVEVEGAKQIASLDIAREAGFRRPLKRTFQVDVTDGLLTLVFKPETAGAIVSAMEIVPLTRD